MIQEHIK